MKVREERMKARLRLAGVILAGGSLLHAAAPASDDPGALAIRVTAPSPSAPVPSSPAGEVFVAAQVLDPPGVVTTHDVMLVLDVSASTARPSGSDIDGDGHSSSSLPLPVLLRFPVSLGKVLLQAISLGTLPPDRMEDSVLAAELRAADEFLDTLSPRTTRVGLIAFSGDAAPSTPDANVVVELTSDYDRIREGLEEIRNVGPVGRTNHLAAVRVATVELLGSSSASSTPRPNARRIAVMMSDGRPTLPVSSRIYSFHDPTAENIALAEAAAAEAAKLGIVLHTFAIGDEASAEALAPLARATGGRHVSIERPGELPELVASTRLSPIERVVVENLTTRSQASAWLQSPDGHVFALVPTKPGRNAVRICVGAGDASAEIRFEVDVQEGAPTPELDLQASQARSRLLEQRLEELRRAPPATPGP